MAHTVDRALQAWATRATDDHLAAGPTLDDLGGRDAALTEAPTLAAGPQLRYLVHAAAHALEDTTTAPLLAAIVQGITRPHAAWVLAAAIDALCERPALLARLGDQPARRLTTHAETALEPDNDHAAYAQPAISGMLRLAISGQARPHRLLALLTEITGGEPVDALERLPILIGVAHDHFDEPALLDVLTTIENRADLPHATRADAGFELAQADLRNLQAGDRADTELHLGRALLRLTRLDHDNENRLDARAAAIDAILAFSALEHDPGSDQTRTRLKNATDSLETTLDDLTAWTFGLHELDWLSARGLAQGAWARLVTALRVAATRLTEPSWYEPAAALNDLLAVYLASRSIHAPTDSPTGGISALVAPTIEAPFLRNEGRRHQLQQALLHDERFTEHPDAIALLHAIQERASHETATGAAVPGKALEGRPELAQLLRTLPGDLDATFLDNVEDHLRHARLGYTPTGNHRFDGHLEELLETLRASPAWRPPESHQFTTLLEQFLRFMYDRFDAQADLYGERTAYLGPPRPDDEGRVRPWPEKHLQDDLHQHLSGTLIPGTVQREIMDIAGGRTDITYTPQPGNRFVIEVKRRESRSARETVEQVYLAQATNYTATGPPFGMLIVGDHSNHHSGYSDVHDRIWITHHARTPTETPRLVVVGVLPIGRPTPHTLRMP
ncbi:hypothetical protein [Embleya scabrispora]|uniref:hypothetical protein n=1 Tax=Embleya scabrispora TaxID=159449 RepID=UPI000370E1BD|nr:hypothetical protein [Embleya scabrispora]MYS82030.1 hypothetical protein [Streptomyces sp. SID5474]